VAAPPAAVVCTGRARKCGASGGAIDRRPDALLGIAARGAAFAAILFAALESFPGNYWATTPGLDASWVWAINELGVQGFGPDVAFTYGPLGFILYPGAVRSHVIAAGGVRLALQTVFVVVSVYLSRSASLAQTFLLAAGWALASALGLPADFQIVVLATAVAAIACERQSIALLVLLAVACGPLLYVKSSLALVATGVVFLAAAVWWHRHRAIAPGLVGLGVNLVSTVVTGLLIFGSPARLFGWLKMVRDLMDGYSIAMSITDGTRVHFGIAIGLAWLLLAAVLYAKRGAAATFAILSIPVVFVAFKQGFVREDGHVIVFCTCLPALAALLTGFSRGMRETRWAVGCLGATSIACCLLLFAGGYLDRNAIRDNATASRGIRALKETLHPEGTMRDLLAVSASALESDRLPDRVLAPVRAGGGAMSVIPFELTYCTANRVPCHFNATLQTYAAYTMFLDRVSAAHYETNARPSFVLVHQLDDIDGRNAVLDAPLVWRALFKWYELESNPLLAPILLRRRHEPFPGEAQDLGTVITRLGDWIDVPKANGLIHVEMPLKLTVRGELTKALLRIPAVRLEVEYQSGQVAFIRITPALAADGLLVDPLPRSLDELAGILAGTTTDRVVRFRIVGAGTAYYEREVRAHFISSPRPPPTPALPAAASARRAKGGARVGIETPAGGPLGEGLVVRADGFLRFRGWAVPPPGAQAASAVVLDVDHRWEIPLFYGLERGDIATGLHDPGARFSGFAGTVAARELGPGVHDLGVRVFSGDDAFEAPQRVRVQVE
jgi:hypothetical protein